MNRTIQSLIIVGTVTYLHQQTLKSSGNTVSQRLSTTALQGSYLFYLAGVVRTHAKIEAPRFAKYQRTAFLITPILMVIPHCFTLDSVPLPGTLGHIFYGGSMIAGIAASSFGNIKQSLSTLGMFVVPPIAQANRVTKFIIDIASAACAAIAYLSFTAWVLDSNDTLLKVATVATGIIFFFSKTSNFPEYVSHGRPPPHHPYKPYPSGTTYSYTPTPYRGSSGSTSSTSNRSFLQSFSTQPYCTK